MLSNGERELLMQKRLTHLSLVRAKAPSMLSNARTRLRLYGEVAYLAKLYIFIRVDADQLAERSMPSDLSLKKFGTPSTASHV